MYAAVAGHEPVVRMLLERGGRINQKSRQGNTPLMNAVVLGRTKSVRLLLELGANPNTSDPTGITALMAAVVRGNLGAVQLLLDRRADPNRATAEKATSLHLAAGFRSPSRFKRSADIIKVLLRKGANPNARGARGFTPLMVASRTGNPDAVKALLARGAKPNLKNSAGHTALRLARASKSSKSSAVAALLRKAGAT
jgi:ankyrin repeat protein